MYGTKDSSEKSGLMNQMVAQQEINNNYDCHLFGKCVANVNQWQKPAKSESAVENAMQLFIFKNFTANSGVEIAQLVASFRSHVSRTVFVPSLRLAAVFDRPPSNHRRNDNRQKFHTGRGVHPT